MIPLRNGATLVAVAIMAKADTHSPHITVGNFYKVDEVVALDWIRQAAEAGYDTGRPRLPRYPQPLNTDYRKLGVR